ncbi:hypothetical protein AB835_12500 [Candidatus Endobugula sertula]|uniref:Uncharacterized protein n=1 Tax=Candidatus Endobugula sertula TaxID=62101 RepID=A0A1D2QMG1_9GAMM|nr:hypothetical protein AB835_12500 [Candidatus Endobugula sertula]
MGAGILMKQSLIAYLLVSPLTVLCIMTVSFLGFGYFSVNLFLLFKANIDLINQFGAVAIREGAAEQLFILLWHAFISVIFYVIWKIGERLLVDWAVGKGFTD